MKTPQLNPVVMHSHRNWLSKIAEETLANAAELTSIPARACIQNSIHVLPRGQHVRVRREYVPFLAMLLDDMLVGIRLESVPVAFVELRHELHPVQPKGVEEAFQDVHAHQNKAGDADEHGRPEEN